MTAPGGDATRCGRGVKAIRRHWKPLLLLTVLIIASYVHKRSTPAHQVPVILFQIAVGVLGLGQTYESCAPCGCNSDTNLFRACMTDAKLESLGLRRPSAQQVNEKAAELIVSVVRPMLSTDECVAVEEKLQSELSGAAAGRPVTPWHWYVRTDLYPDLQRAQLDAIASWLTTQDLSSNVLIMWVPAGMSPPPSLGVYARLYPGVVTWRALNILAETVDTPFERSYLRYLHDGLAYIDGDIARLTLLYKYGGFWSDLDMYYLNDMKPLTSSEFSMEFACYRSDWAKDSDWNGALMHYFPRGRNIDALCQMSLRRWPSLNSGRYGPQLLHDIHETEGAGAGYGPMTDMAMPWCFFHGMWCGGGISSEGLLEDGPWRGTSQERVMRRAYALHVHGAGVPGRTSSKGVHEQSMLVHMSREAQAKLEAQLVGKYGPEHALVGWYRSVRGAITLCPPGAAGPGGWCKDLSTGHIQHLPTAG